MPTHEPTTEEILELTEGKDLFRSNLFRMQVSELLTEVKIKQKRTKPTQEQLHELKTTLESLPDQDITQKYIEKLAPPLHNPASDPKLSFKFHAPSKLQVIGSFLLQTVCRPSNNVDLAIEIPKVRGSRKI